MTEAAILGLMTLVASAIGALVTLLVGRGQSRTTGVTALTDDQREFAQQLLNENARLQNRMDDIEKQCREYRQKTEEEMAAMRRKMSKMENTLIAHQLPIPNGEHQ